MSNMKNSTVKTRTYEVGSIHSGNIHRDYEKQDGALQELLKFYKQSSVDPREPRKEETDFDSIENWLDED